MSARDVFNAALLDLLDNGRRVPCAADDRFTSEEPAELAAAAPLCRPCPLIDTCGQLATEERPAWGVWAGIDRSPRTRNPGRPNATPTTIEQEH